MSAELPRTESLIKDSEDYFSSIAQNHTRTVLTLNAHRELCDALDLEVLISVGWSLTGLAPLNISFYGDTERLLSICSILKEKGYKPHPENTVTDEKTTSWEGKFVKENKIVSLNFTSSVCRRVKVGTKMVEEDVFEIQCGEEKSSPGLEVPVRVPESFDSDDKIRF